MESQLGYFVSDVSKFPVLNSLIEQGHVWIVRDQIMGMAADGVTCLLGNAFSEVEIERTERYLADGHSTPNTW